MHKDKFYGQVKEMLQMKGWTIPFIKAILEEVRTSLLGFTLARRQTHKGYCVPIGRKYSF
jgi:hypothetical protein